MVEPWFWVAIARFDPTFNFLRVSASLCLCVEFPDPATSFAGWSSHFFFFFAFAAGFSGIGAGAAKSPVINSTNLAPPEVSAPVLPLPET